MYDKNGCGNPNLYCWRCSGKEDDDVKVMTNGDKRVLKGCMKPIEANKDGRNRFECIDCGYNTNYYSDYIKSWKI